MIKRILLPLDNSVYTDAAVEHACNIAKSQKAEVTGMVVLDIGNIEKMITTTPVGGIYLADEIEAEELKKVTHHIDKLLYKFKDKCRNESVKFMEFVEQGSPSKRIVQFSKYYDLLIMGMRTFYHYETEGVPGDSLQKTIDHSITPVLAVPDSYKPIKNVIIAFDGSLPAARALQRFAHLASPFNFNINIVCSSENEKDAEFHLFMASQYLEAYGLEKFRTTRTKKNIKDAILYEIKDDSDLIVMGAHSKNFINKFMMGSLSKFFINRATNPVFIGL